MNALTILFALATLLYVSKPSEGEVMRLAIGILRSDAVGGAALRCGREAPDTACHRALWSAGVVINSKDRVLWRRVDVSSQGARRGCVALLNRLVCPGAARASL